MLLLFESMPPSQHKTRLDIQGFRALAVLSVMIFHANAAWLPAGFLGVDIFFVISGYIITSLIHTKTTFSLKQFYLARIKRILPAYFFLLISGSLVASILFTPQDFSSFFASFQAALIFASNQYFMGFGDYFAPNTSEQPLLHTWSLAIEMQFYLLLPLLLVTIPRKYWLSALLIISTSLLIWNFSLQTLTTTQEQYFSLLSRIPEFLIGAIFALLPFSVKQKHPQWLSISAIVMIIIGFLIIRESNFPNWMVILPCFAIGLLLISPQAKINHLFAHPLLVWIGNISYSLYLWHWVILAFIRYINGQYLLSSFDVAIYITLSFVAATLSYYTIENPIRKFSQLKALSIAATLGTTAAMLIFALPLINQQVVPAVPLSFTRYADNNQICHGKMLKNCLQGDLSSTNQPILVIGDSHAAQLNLALSTAGKSINQSFKIVTASSCVPISGFPISNLANWAKKPCQQQIKNLEKQLPQYHTIILAGMWSHHIHDQHFQTALKQFLNSSLARHQKIIVMAQIPMFDNNIARLNRINQLGFHFRAKSNQEWQQSNQYMQQTSNHYPNVIWLNFEQASLFQTTPFYKGELIYYDSHHLNEIGAKAYGKTISDALQQILQPKQP